MYTLGKNPWQRIRTHFSYSNKCYRTLHQEMVDDWKKFLVVFFTVSKVILSTCVVATGCVMVQIGWVDQELSMV